MFGKVGVLMGGISEEREISILSGKAITHALRQTGVNVREIVSEGNLHKELMENPVDIAFIALHGRYGEDGTAQMILEEMGIPYTGSGVAASELAINKKKTKLIFEKKGIPTPPWEHLQKGFFTGTTSFSFPVVVKPVTEGSSIGLSIVRDNDILRRTVMFLFKKYKELIIEQYIPGKELTVGILGAYSLPVIHIAPKRNFYDFVAKYEKGNTDYCVPANLLPERTRFVQNIALAAHNALGCRDMSRVDMILSDDGSVNVLEINTIPGFTETSLLPKAAQAQGISFEQLCLRILEMAYNRKIKIMSH